MTRKTTGSMLLALIAMTLGATACQSAPVPEADPQDGLLDVLLIKKVSRLQVAQVIGKYKAGRYAELPNLVRHIKTNRVVIRCDGPTAINLDGELRVSDTVNIRVSEKKIRFFYPKGLTYSKNIPATL